MTRGDPSPGVQPDIPEEDASLKAEASSVSRRAFLKGAGATVAAVGVAGPGASLAAERDESVPMIGLEGATIGLMINGKRHQAEIEASSTLLDTLRDRLRLTGTKRVCDRGSCGACTVLLDGVAVNSCAVLAIDAADREITTVEGVAIDGQLTPLQEAFVECDAMQCGFCTPGMVVACSALLKRNPHPTRSQVADALAGNICRCGTYQNIFEAVALAASKGVKRGR